MKVKLLFVSQGTYGDLIKTVSLARRFMEDGFDVEFISYSVFESYVCQFDVPFYGVCTENQYRNMVDKSVVGNSGEICLHHYESCGQYAAKSIFKRVAYHHSRQKCVVFSQYFCDGAIWAVDEFDIPYFRISLSPHDTLLNSNPKLPTDPSDSFDESIQNKIREIAITVRKSLGLEAIDEIPFLNPIALVCFYPNVFLTSYLDEGYSIGDKKIIFVRDPYIQLDQDEPEEIYDVIYTCGSAFTLSDIEVERFISACEKLKISGLLVSNNKQYKGISHPLVSTRDWVNYSYLLPSAKLFIHHGGIGACIDSVYANTPQLIIPRAFDQYENARLMKILGVAEVFEKKNLDQEHIFIQAVSNAIASLNRGVGAVSEKSLKYDEYEALLGEVLRLTSPKTELRCSSDNTALS